MVVFKCIASKPKIRRSCGFEVSRNASGIWLAGEGEGGLRAQLELTDA